MPLGAALQRNDETVRTYSVSSLAELTQLAQRIDAGTWPGGLDRALSFDDVRTVVGQAVTPQTAVVLASDFRQDDGTGWQELLENLRASEISWWQLGDEANNANAYVQGTPTLPDFLPDRPGSWLVPIAGPVDQVSLAIDDGPALPVQHQRSGDGILIDLPALSAGSHTLHLTLQDAGLTYDNMLSWPVVVRDRVPVRLISEQQSAWTAAVLADQQRLDAERWQVVDLGLRAWPEQGAIVLARNVPEYDEKLQDWLEQGGVLWVDSDAVAGAQWESYFTQDLEPGNGGALDQQIPAQVSPVVLPSTP